jgi:hypothetical protein
MNDYILELKDFVPVDLCNEMITRFDDDQRKHNGFYNYYLEQKLYTRMKNNKELLVSAHSDWKDIDEKLLYYFKKAFHEYIKHVRIEFNYSTKEHIYDRELDHIKNRKTTDIGFAIAKIPKGTSYPWHHDGAMNSSNFVQFVLYLNTLEENEGGCTGFLNGRKVRPEVGKMLMYPCTWTFPHTGYEVKAEYKYICTTTFCLDNYQQ